LSVEGQKKVPKKKGLLKKADLAGAVAEEVPKITRNDTKRLRRRITLPDLLTKLGEKLSLNAK